MSPGGSGLGFIDSREQRISRNIARSNARRSFRVEEDVSSRSDPCREGWRLDHGIVMAIHSWPFFLKALPGEEMRSLYLR